MKYIQWGACRTRHPWTNVSKIANTLSFLTALPPCVGLYSLAQTNPCCWVHEWNSWHGAQILLSKSTSCSPPFMAPWNPGRNLKMVGRKYYVVLLSIYVSLLPSLPIQRLWVTASHTLWTGPLYLCWDSLGWKMPSEHKPVVSQLNSPARWILAL